MAKYDAYAILTQNSSGVTAMAAALNFLKIEGQVAMTASMSDKTGLQMTLAALNAGAINTPLNLTNTSDLMSAGVASAQVTAAANLNQDMHDANNFASAKQVWNDWAGKQDQLKPFLNHMDAISIHINQAPVGVAPENL